MKDQFKVFPDDEVQDKFVRNVADVLHASPDRNAQRAMQFLCLSEAIGRHLELLKTLNESSDLEVSIIQKQHVNDEFLEFLEEMDELNKKLNHD